MAERVDVPPFESDLLRVDFTNRGAGIRQVHLKRYTNHAGEDPADPANQVALFPEDPSSDAAMALAVRPMTGGSGIESSFWEVSRDETVDGVRTLVFGYQTADGLRFEKEIVCRPDSYALDVRLRTSTSNDAQNFIGREYLLIGSSGVKDVPRGWFTEEVGAPAAVAYRSGKHGEGEVFRYTSDDLAGSPETYRSIAWVGGANLYFLALLEPIGVPLETIGATLSASNGDLAERFTAGLTVLFPFARDGDAKETAFRYYVGPKDPLIMKEQGLESFIPLVEEDYGWSFRWINELLLSGLRFFHGFVGNWGLAIILLTLVVRLCVFPVTRMQQVSMQRYSQKMQVLKPKLDKLRDRHKNNPQKFAQEQMKLLKEHDARPPLVGCLSMFVTFPVFIGMFQLLRTAIELRQAPFVGWIGDLSLPDSMFTVAGFAFNLLPILATGAFVVQMMLAPKPADPQAQQQQKIMTFMPIVFGVMFYGYAAGLSLYMLTTSLFSIFETHFIRKKFFPTPAPA